jgi:hypothetical protein
MKRLILRLTVAILAFGLGIAIDRIFISPKLIEAPKVERCDPSRIEVKTIFVPPGTPPTLEIFDLGGDSFPPTGTFYLSKTPTDFEDFNFLNLWWWRPNGEIEGDGVINVQAKGVPEEHRTLVLLVTRRRVLIVTESQSGSGLGYRFEGEFVQHKNLQALEDSGKPILRGTLTKTKNGKKVSQRFVSFWREDPSHC